MTITDHDTLPAADTEPAASAFDPADAGELTDALTAAVRKTVTAQLDATAREIADGVVADALTDGVVLGIRQRALEEARAAVDPEYPVEEPVEPPRELCYRTLDAFVEQHIAQLYRRDVSSRGVDSSRRWCPVWWEHGEVTARFRAMWLAFEQLRQGPGAEMNTWWIQHCDPQMDRVLDPQGPFRYCSVTEGHKNKLPALPVVPAPAGMFEDGHAHDDITAAPVPVSSRLELPRPPHAARRTLMEFP